ncbi:ABC transporter permease [Treponema pedis]|uniref:Peptide ABC transporter permease n=2 Tax=Treponema pedis TaxID=409322 RepID=S6A8X0_9SPIR|nr:ABC transporter permease [Treponema pedis]AGT44564.1 peptide ABC transporter permease [Treponema pedis str. T A4]QOW59897.1 ABC transporter permease [Treponema pedis]QSI05240.1 ABC transporter permease [Treponema pedis]
MEITKDMFVPISKNIEEAELIVRPSISFWQDVWRRLRKNPVAIASLILLAFLVIMVIFGPYFNEFEFNRINSSLKDISPNSTYWFGTDSAGRDIFTRVWVAGRVSLEIGFLAALLSTSIGILYGSISGFIGGRTDTIMMRIIEILSALPYLLVVILFQIRLQDRSLKTLLLALTITGWTGTARIVRGEVLRVKAQEFILAARTLGVSAWKIIVKHLIPNVMPIVIVSITFNVPGFIFAEAFLSYLGIGLAPPATSWGIMCAEAQTTMMFYPYQLIFPTLMISLVMLVFALLGDGLRDALDPKLRK